MATTRIKDISKTTTDLASDTYGVFDGATNGTQKMARNDMYADWAAAYVAAPTTYKLAPLNSGTNKIDATYLPTSGDTPKGEWNASSNSPALADGSGTAGDYYDVTTAGSQNLGSGSIAYTVGDVVKYNGSTWYKIDSVANILDGSATAADGRSALSVNSIDEDAQANALKTTAPALYFNGSSSVVTVADDAKLSFTDGTDDLPFSAGGWVKMDDASSFALITKYGVTGSTREYVFDIQGSDFLRFFTQDTSGNASYILSDVALTSYEGKWVHIAFTYGGAGPNSASGFATNMSGGNAVLYVNGVPVNSTATNNASYLGMSNTAAAVQVGALGSSYAEGSIRDCKIFNRELTASEVAELARGNDLGFADEWGGAEVYTGDSSTFASSLGNWAEEGATAITVAQSGGEMVITNTAATTGTRGARNTTDTLTEGKRYRISWTSRASSGTGQTLTLNVFNSSPLAAISKLAGSGTAGSVGSATVYTFTPTGSAERHSLEFILTGSGTDSLYFNMANTGAGEVYNFDDLTLTQIGNLADFRSERYDTSTNKLYDLSDNAFVGTGTSVTLTGREVPVYKTSTWTPVLIGATTSDFTYNIQEGYYTRIGDLCYVHGIVSLSNLGTSAGAMSIGGLPFASLNASGQQMPATIGFVSGMTGLTSSLSAAFGNNSTSISLWKWTATGVSSVIETDMTNSADIRFGGIYKIQ